MSKQKVILTGFADEGQVSTGRGAVDDVPRVGAVVLQPEVHRRRRRGEKRHVVDRRRGGAVAELLEEFEINVSSIGSPLGKVKLLDADDGTHNRYVPFERYVAESMPRAVELVQAFGAKLIRGFSFYSPKGTYKGLSYRRRDMD